MSEPARKLDDEAQPNLRSIRGGGNTNSDRAQGLRLAENNNSDDGYIDELAARRKALNKQEMNPETKSSSSINDQEKNGSNVVQGPWANKLSGQKNNPKNNNERFSFVKKKGPLISIIITLFGGGLITLTTLSPALLPLAFKENLADVLNDASPALSIKSDKRIYSKFKSTKDAFAESSDGKCNIKCRMGSINDTMKQNLESKGFKVETITNKNLVGGQRHIITALEFPATDGPPQRITTGAEFEKVMKNTARASSFRSAFNSKTAFFLNTKFGTVLRQKFNLNKIATLSEELKKSAVDSTKTTADRVNDAIRRTLGLPEVDSSKSLSPIDTIKTDPNYKKSLDFIEGPISSTVTKTASIFGKATNVADKPSDIVGAICTAYNVSKGVTFATKIAKRDVITGFAMMFLTSIDQWKAGDSNEELMTIIGNKFTQPDENGYTATDSQGLKTIFFNKTDPLTDEDNRYSIAATSKTLGILTTLASAATLGGIMAIGVNNMSSLCRLAGSDVLDIAVVCSSEIVAAAFGLVGSGGIVTLGALGVCAAKLAIMQGAISLALKTALSNIIPAIAENETPKLDEKTRGKALGNALYTGTAQIFGGSSASYGMKAGTVAEIEQYAIDTAEMRKQDKKIAYYEARNTPFDIYNQYSFLGSMIRKMGVSSFSNTEILSKISSIFSFIPKSLASLTTSVGAESYNKADIYGKCNDLGLKSIGVEADAFCNPSYVMSSEEINADTYEVIDRLIDRGDIDEDGNPIPDSDYQKYITYCADRVEPLGETSSMIEEKDYEWKVGYMCTTNSQEFSDYRSFTMDKAINDTMDES